MLISGIDVRLFALIPGQTAAIPIAEASHINISLFRDKKPVRALSYIEERGRTRGPRTCAGSLIFTVLYGKVLSEIFKEENSRSLTPAQAILEEQRTGVSLGINQSGDFLTNIEKQDIILLLDQLPPITVIGVAATEDSRMKKFIFALQDLEFLSENTSMGISDLAVESATQFTAKHYFPLDSLDSFTSLSQSSNSHGVNFSDITSSAKYQKALTSAKNIGL